MSLDKMTLKERLEEWKTFAQSNCVFVLFNEDINEVLELYEKQEEINLYNVSNEPTKITEKAMRTEQEILKDFEKLGFEVKENSNYEIKLSINDNYTIIISRWFRTYRAVYNGLIGHQVSSIGMKEHKLLHELFTFWGWI